MAIALQTPARLWTRQEYLERERAAQTRSEYIGGEIRAMSGGSIEHSQIGPNIIIALGPQLRGTDCTIHSPDLRVRGDFADVYYYPDLTVICGTPTVDIFDQNTVSNPTLLVEVLSPSTENTDRVEKWEAYRQIPSLQAYLLVSQDRPLVEVYTRQSEIPPLWSFASYADLTGVITLPSPPVTLALADIYSNIF